MSQPCNNIVNPLMPKREGTNQAQRAAAALLPASAPVDQHEVADWLVFSQQLSRYVKYYRFDNLFHNEDWQAFFAHDESAILAVVAVQEVDSYKRTIQEILNKDIRAELDNNPVNEIKLKQDFANLFAQVATLAWALEELWRRLPDTIALKLTLQNLIKTRLATELNKLREYFNAASPNLIDESNLRPGHILGEKVGKASVLLARTYSSNWNDTTVVDPNIFGPTAPGEVARKIYFAVNHNFFTTIFDQFLRVLTKITSDAKTQLAETLAQRPTHEPHQALFLAFLKLLLYTRDHLNTITQQHLDFYYQQVLQLTRKPAASSQAHLIFTLAQHLESLILPRGTLLKAGKDSLGQEVVFALNYDFAPNKAQVTALKSFYHATPQDELEKKNSSTIFQGHLYAAPIANSDDGLGAELTSPDKQWHPLAAKIYDNGKLSHLAMPAANLGFAVASPHLFLTEGDRTIEVKFYATSAAIPVGDYSGKVNCRVTNAAGWHPVPDATFRREASYWHLKLQLPPDAPATAPYQPAVHEGPFATSAPVVQVFLKQSAQEEYIYDLIKEAVVTQMDLTVTGKGLKNLQLASDFGAIDPTQPFQPFGPFPQKDSALIIGHAEVFQKKNAAFSVYINWKDLPATINSNPTVAVDFLRQGLWANVNSDPNLFDGSAGEGNRKSLSDASAARLVFTVTDNDRLPVNYKNIPRYTIQSTKGYIRLWITSDFGHKAYQQQLTDYLISKASGIVMDKQAIQKIITDQTDKEKAVTEISAKINALPNLVRPAEPYTPVIQEIVLDYTATVSLNLSSTSGFEDRPVQFFHVHPFGTAEMHPALQRPDLQEELTISLVPLFRRKNTGNPFFIVKETDGTIQTWKEHEGEFYLGLTSAAPPQNIAVLFQVVEGSANPNLLKPEHHVHWSYLTGNHWASFLKEEVSDGTGQLTRSGIITFSLPRAADTDHTLLPGGIFWLRAAVHTASEAVCSFIAVMAQAATATFQDQRNAEDFLALPLPAGSITELQEPLAGITEVAQPFASFGGHLKETPPHFYQRVSERLRHKDRGVTIWDYEHLTLEAFPGIYKVKCLPHTQYDPGLTGGIYNEQAAGHVTVVTIPNLRQKNHINPLQPYTSLGELEKIEAFLRRHFSCFVKLHVRNPIFEQVQVKCRVKYFPAYDPSAYEKLLNQEITRFLSPWAYGYGQDLQFGGKIYASTLIDFIEERPYVDYITDFELWHLPSNGLPDTKTDAAVASKACSVLVSVPEEQHELLLIPINAETSLQEKCGC
ncbi:MAG: baseplate J/gp47 family protein [Adhaeribacter sp.]